MRLVLHPGQQLRGAPAAARARIRVPSAGGSVRGTFKLSQDMPPDVRARVRADLRAAHPQLAELMAAHDPG
ncbi:hypothetical protein ACFQ0O_27285 [Saccharopolyspora spinosporotrichia]|uniref:Uncharacterized protein n=1 Tax=Saccharopolyspora erythraea (strain ATCC 11635 / DSM 40517 / JCM 4748 / NBRC 13426 / NCIMB 8594 / NRRL 2338) TaxID=405948 RepID=A4FKJ0_SACEN|nr:hypothetical protein SACE_5326 [Saccharopolyspora erythraea NRRL 2338]